MSKPTLNDVAKHANVSTATVSRFINDPSVVRSATADKIKEAIEVLGYPISSNHNEQKKQSFEQTKSISKESTCILVNLPHFNNTTASLVIKGISDTAELGGFQVLVYSKLLNKSTEDYFFKLLEKVNFAGAIFLNRIHDDIYKKLLNTIPFVICSETSETQTEVSSVTNDDINSIAKVVKYLISLNRRKIALLTVADRYKYGKFRKQGYLQGLEEASVPVNQEWIKTVPDSDFDSAYSEVCSLLSQEETPNAIVCVSDILASAAILACKNSGKCVPEDIMVTGFDNSLISKSTSPSITTMNLPAYQIGSTACDLLLDIIKNPDDKRIQHIEVPNELIIRESTSLPIATK